MKTFLKSVALVSILAGSLNAYGAGGIKVTVVDSSGTKVLDVTDTGGGEFTGTYSSGASSQPVYALFSNTSLHVEIGVETSDLSVSRSSTDILYNGNLGSRSTDIDIDIKNGKLKYGGDNIGAFTDFAGKADSDSLVNFWGQAKLRLEPDLTVAGGCKGELKIGSTTKTVTCQTTGDYANIFFRDSDHVVAWLVNLLAK